MTRNDSNSYKGPPSAPKSTRNVENTTKALEIARPTQIWLIVVRLAQMWLRVQNHGKTCKMCKKSQLGQKNAQIGRQSKDHRPFDSKSVISAQNRRKCGK
jgi:hypothetical protein